VRGKDRCDVAVIFGSTAEFRIYEFQRDNDMIDALRKLGGGFWHDNVLGAVAPAVDGSESARRTLNALYPSNRRPLEDAPPAAEEWFVRRQRACEQIEALETEKRLATNKLCELIGDADGIVGGWGRATWKADKRGQKSLRVYPAKERTAAA